MTFLFIVILFFLLILNLQFTKDFFHPTIIFKTVWLISSLILLFYQGRWGVSLSLQTISIFLLGFISFDIGFVVFYLIRKNTSNKMMKSSTYINSKSVPDSILKKSRLILLLLITVLMSLYLLYDVIKLMDGFSNVFSNDFFTKYRSLKYDGTDSTNIQQFLFRGLEVIGISTFIFYLREKDLIHYRKFLYFSIIIICFVMQVLTTGRMRFLAILVEASIIVLMHAKKNGKELTFKNQKKYIKNISIVAILFFIIFFFYGKFAVDKIDVEDPLHSIAIYTSASLPAFSNSLLISQNTSEYFGQHVLAPIYNISNKLFGIDFSIDNQASTKHFLYGDNGFSTNVYTFYHEQVIDFGIWIIPFVMVVIGMFLAYLKYKSENEYVIGFWTGLYSMFIFSLVISFFQDAFFTNSTFTYMSVILLLIVFKTEIINSKIKVKKL